MRRPAPRLTVKVFTQVKENNYYVLFQRTIFLVYITYI